MAIAIHEQTKKGLKRENQRIEDTPPTQEPSSPSKVFLVGAGPGDPELITLKALRCLRQADVVLYDRLICPDLLDEAPPHAELVFVGKASDHHSIKQEEINTLLIHHALQGRIVVRLKGGDPFVFGRGGEEALALAEAGIPFEIVPGISSAIAVPAYAGIPVTHRDFASSVTIVTGHEQHGPHSSPSNGANWQALAALGGTLVILMGVESLPHITSQLLNGGLPADTPAAVIQQGTVLQQHVATGKLANIAERATNAHIKSPAVIVIGKVVALGDPLAWFEGTASPLTNFRERSEISYS
jgi:uroporphyrin-III C-methyltransferase